MLAPYLRGQYSTAWKWVASVVSDKVLLQRSAEYRRRLGETQPANLERRDEQERLPEKRVGLYKGGRNTKSKGKAEAAGLQGAA